MQDPPLCPPKAEADVCVDDRRVKQKANKREGSVCSNPVIQKERSRVCFAERKKSNMIVSCTYSERDVFVYGAPRDRIWIKMFLKTDNYKPRAL